MNEGLLYLDYLVSIKINLKLKYYHDGFNFAIIVMLLKLSVIIYLFHEFLASI